MDSYIDNQETQTYGDRFSGNLRRIVGVDAPPPVIAMLGWCADRLDAATLTMRGAMAASRGAQSERGATAEEKLPVVKAARGELRSFALHLAARKSDAHDPWNGDPHLFLPHGLTGIGKGARNLRDATLVAREHLAHEPSVPDHTRWIARLDAQLATLEPLVTRGDEAERARLVTLSEQSSEKRAWLRTYRGAALILEGVLLMMGRAAEYTAAVPHLTAPDTRRPAASV